MTKETTPKKTHDLTLVTKGGIVQKICCDNELFVRMALANPLDYVNCEMPCSACGRKCSDECVHYRRCISTPCSTRRCVINYNGTCMLSLSEDCGACTDFIYEDEYDEEAEDEDQ